MSFIAQCIFCKHKVIGGMGASCRCFFLACDQMLPPIFADRIQHHESRFLFSQVDPLQQAFVHQRCHAVEHIQLKISFRVADSFHTF